MNSTINEVVRNTISERHGEYVLRQYGSTIDAVVEALDARLEAGLQSLRETAASQRLSSGVVEQALVTAGLVTPEPEPEPETEIGALQRTVNSLVEFARSHGFRG